MDKRLVVADTLAFVTCEHPEDSPKFYRFAFHSSDFKSDEEIRKVIEKEVNPNHYWFNVKIEIPWCFKYSSEI